MKQEQFVSHIILMKLRFRHEKINEIFSYISNNSETVTGGNFCNIAIRVQSNFFFCRFLYFNFSIWIDSSIKSKSLHIFNVFFVIYLFFYCYCYLLTGSITLNIDRGCFDQFILKFVRRTHITVVEWKKNKNTGYELCLYYLNNTISYIFLWFGFFHCFFCFIFMYTDQIWNLFSSSSKWEMGIYAKKNLNVPSFHSSFSSSSQINGLVLHFYFYIFMLSQNRSTIVLLVQTSFVSYYSLFALKFT